jgi:hypothetical protein
VTAARGAFAQVPLQRRLLRFLGLPVKLRRIEQWKISASHVVLIYVPLPNGRGTATASRGLAGRGVETDRGKHRSS